VTESFLIRDGENLRYCQDMQVPGSKDSMDVSFWGERTELCYETSGSGTNAYNLKFSWDCWPSVKDCEYSMHLRSCSDCFGCVGLKKKQYCILNRQYTKEEYFEMVDKIKKHMDDMPYIDKKERVYKYGEFFPIELSPYGYNNTLVWDYFPITELEAQNQSYRWIDVSPGEYTITKKTSELPSAISDVSNEILKEIIECEKCQKPYRILENEYNFLKNENLPLPSLCVNCRHSRRIEDRLKLFLYDRKCMCNGSNDITNTYKNTSSHTHKDSLCREKFKTGYSPDKSEIIYCESCYQQEVI